MRRNTRIDLWHLGLLLCLIGWPARAHSAQSAWQPASAPLLTRWAREVRPDRVRPEYPRPLLVRKEWQSLNGLWEFAFDDRDEGRHAGWQRGKALPLRILVPFTFEAALSGIGKGDEVHERVWYRRAFTVPAAWRGRRIRLHFNASDWETTVWVNGRLLGTHRGGYDPFSFDITDLLKPEGPQELVAAIYDPADPRSGAYQPKGKQLGSRGIWYTRTTGIWQSVWLEPVHPAGLDVAWIQTRVDPGTRQGEVTVSLRGSDQLPDRVEIAFSRGGREVQRHGFSPRARRGGSLVRWTVPHCELWSPERPVLYELRLRASLGGRVVDEVRSYCAFRRYEVKNGRLALNGKPYFLRGVLDQGYWPDGILTAPTDAAIRNDVMMLKNLGLNLARKHVKIEDPRWYYWCDHLGVLVWQDMPSSHNLASDAAKENFRREWRAAISAVRSYPCVVHWIPFNENWGNPGAFQDEIVQITRSLDASRPITDASGWTQRDLTDVIDAHDYGNNLIRQGVANPVKPKVVGEFGGIALPVPGHTWTSGWGYQTARDPDGLLRRIRTLTTQLFAAPNLSGFVYTQLTDVEQELNGLMTYDRLPKADPAQLAAIFEGRSRADLHPAGFLHDWLVLGPLPAGTEIRTAQDSPENRATIDRILAQPFLPDEAALRPTSGDSAQVGNQHYQWKQVHVDGEALDFHRVFGTEAHNSVTYAVASFDSPREVKNATLLFGSDDGAKVWLNGRLIWTVDHVRGVSLDEDAVSGLTLQPGRNLLVVKVAQGVGGWGLAARFEMPK